MFVAGHLSISFAAKRPSAKGLTRPHVVRKNCDERDVTVARITDYVPRGARAHTNFRLSTTHQALTLRASFKVRTATAENLALGIGNEEQVSTKS